MADDKSDLFREFEEFLTQKKAAEDAEKESEDFEVEIWDEKGKGVRTRRSHARPFLQQLGIDLDSTSESDDDQSDSSKSDASKGNKKGSGQASRKSTGSQSVARKYFVKGG